MYADQKQEFLNHALLYGKVSFEHDQYEPLLPFPFISLSVSIHMSYVAFMSGVPAELQHKCWWRTGSHSSDG